jgi:hypothetical protein
MVHNEHKRRKHRKHKACVQQDSEVVKEDRGALVEKSKISENIRRCRKRDTDRGEHSSVEEQ